MKYIIAFLVMATAVLFPVLLQGDASIYPLGVTIYNPEKCWNGFTILSSDDGRLVDMNGNLVHLWKGLLHHPNKVYPGGFLLTSTAAWKQGRQDAIQIQLRDFGDNILWSFDRWQEGKANEGEGKMWLSRQHHDLQLKGNPVGYYIPNSPNPDTSKGTVLALAHHNTQNDNINRSVRLLDDVVYEIDMATRKITWTWKASEHLNEMGFDAAALNAMQNYSAKLRGEGDGFDWFHQNCVSYLGPNQWFDKGDTRFNPDNIILDSREAGLVAIVDHGSGKIVWRTGPYYRDGDDKKLGWLIGPHHAHMIPRGLPGEGNIMVFDNGGQSGYGPPNDMATNGIGVMRRAYSRVIEFNPVTKDVVWEYAPNLANTADQKSGFDLYSMNVSSAQRLPNGNTLITEGTRGRLIEVTRDREVVWEYISPYLWDSTAPSTRNLVYRAYRVPYDWVPQLPKPKQSAVDPGPNYLRVIPAKDGSRPDFGVDRTPIWKQGADNRPLSSGGDMSLQDLEKRLRALEDAEQIKKLHQHYIDLMDNLRYEEVLDLFTEDATVEVRNSGIKKGRKELAEVYLGLAKIRGSQRYDGHMAVAPDITVDGDNAKGTWLIYMLFSKPAIQWVQGKNECEYRKVDGKWKIARLKFTRTLASDPSMYP